MPISIDPNLVYLGLIAGLWVAVAAVYMPGTGIIEVAAFAICGIAIFCLVNMPTQWASALILVIGTLGFLVTPLVARRFAGLALVGLGLQAVGGFTLFQTSTVSIIVIAITVTASFAYYHFVLARAMSLQHLHPGLIDDQSIIGAYGTVQTTIDPVGAVFVRGESWSARADQPIAAKTQIVVVDRENLTLFVEPMKQKRHEPESLEEA